MSEVRTRFAPSPTGHLHIGGARTALFNFLFARHAGGRFVLRIEDTDRERSKQEYVDTILSSLEWLGIDADEGPFLQSERRALHHDAAARLVDGGHAYYCFCTPEQIEAKREAARADGRKASYDRTCRDLGRRPSDGERAVVRLAAPTEGETVVEDLIRGTVTFDNAELDDLVLVRSDGTPTFHLVVVADDADMGITHVLRGEDHLTNTPKQLQIYRGLGKEPPVYGHLPLIVGKDRARLSKRHGATSVEAYRDAGLLPDAVCNYLARLGWSHGDQEIFSREELVSLFSIEAVGKSASAFDMEKFEWVNFQHMKALSAEELAAAAGPYFDAAVGKPVDRDALAPVVALQRERAKTLVELAEGSRYFVDDELSFDAKAVRKFLDADGVSRLRALAAALGALSDWSAASIETAFAAVLADLDLKLGKLAQPTRVALTGGTVSPGIYDLCAVLGRERTLARLTAACDGAEAGTLAPS